MYLMKISGKKRIVCIILAVCFICAVCAGISFGIRRDNGIVASAEIFHSPNGVTVQKNGKATAPGISDERRGLKLSSSWQQK